MSGFRRARHHRDAHSNFSALVSVSTPHESIQLVPAHAIAQPLSR
ncbi:hypothetical protein BZL30_5516 [Mycobacterium kansasii]|uniref:Uncharacterized protein n=1 Tax=Mycobacterium kansasii TaxID=1768 RepID=A0A1V3WMQ9_MYCKA|nr:hypothetical protein BZL29_6945 [Mycobacterium kansasii]OOK72117.1 hypothetical protein BZL30_5516 [Mycobacterium kansasii]